MSVAVSLQFGSKAVFRSLANLYHNSVVVITGIICHCCHAVFVFLLYYQLCLTKVETVVRYRALVAESAFLFYLHLRVVCIILKHFALNNQ